MTEIIAAVLASSVLSTLINLIGNSRQWKRQRAAAAEDREELKVSELAERMDNLDKAMMSMMLDRIQYLCKCYIKDEGVDADDLRRLHIMHRNYHTLGGNGDLDELMKKVNRLPIK